MKLYVVMFGQLFYKEDSEDRAVFVTDIRDAKLYNTGEYSEARQVAARVKGKVEGLRLEFDRPSGTIWK